MGKSENRGLPGMRLCACGHDETAHQGFGRVRLDDTYCKECRCDEFRMRSAPDEPGPNARDGR